MPTPRTDLAELSDEAMLERFRAGTPGVDRAKDAALGELARRYEAPLLGLARGILGGREDLARDAVQETWIKVIKHASGFEGRSSVKTWLYRIAINRARDMAASKAARPVPQNVTRALTDATAAHADRRDHTADSDDLAALHAALDQLGEASRLILLLCYHRGLTLAQAAEVLDIPLGTLKSRLHTALSTLRTTLAKKDQP
jgi:RNA polymerase sigma-70 factor (ECF subfamily)